MAETHHGCLITRAALAQATKSPMAGRLLKEAAFERGLQGRIEGSRLTNADLQLRGFYAIEVMYDRILQFCLKTADQEEMASWLSGQFPRSREGLLDLQKVAERISSRSSALELANKLAPGRGFVVGQRLLLLKNSASIAECISSSAAVLLTVLAKRPASMKTIGTNLGKALEYANEPQNVRLECLERLLTVSEERANPPWQSQTFQSASSFE